MFSGSQEFLVNCVLRCLAAMTLAAAPAVADVIVMDIADRACLFLDDHFVAEQSGLTRSWHQGKPAPEPAITAEPDAGEDWPHLFGSALFDPRDKLYKMWYESVHGGMGWIRYAESKDGKTWSKPKLGLFEVKGTRDNNVVFAPAELPNVFLDPNDTDPHGRIKIVAWCRQQDFKGHKVGGLYLFRSGDGRDWEPVGPISMPQPTDDSSAARTVLDTNVVGWDPLGQRYFGTWRTFPTHPGLPGFVRDESYKTTFRIGGHRRAVGVSTSQQLRSGWSPNTTVLRADAKDDEKVARLAKDPAKLDYAGLYIMPSFTYGNHYLGLLSLLYWIDESDSTDGCGDLQLTFSHDGTTWHRQPDRQTLVAESPDKLVPCYAQLNEPLHIGDEIWIYFSEANSAHPKTGDTSQIRGASWRRDGFASLDADGKANLTTRAIKFDGNALLVNADISAGGAVRAALLDQNGQPISGFALEECDPLSGDNVAHRVTWRGSNEVSTLRGRTVKLKLESSNARLYSFRFQR